MPIQSLEEKVFCEELVLDKKVENIVLQAIVDYFASSLLARHDPSLSILEKWISNDGGNKAFWLIGKNTLGTARQAAIYNGTLAHLYDIDDVHEEVRGHPSAVILSALLSNISLINGEILTGKDFILAYINGVELMARLGQTIGEESYIKGWHNTPILGGIASTLAICKLYNNKSILNSAMSLAATQASGLRINFGSLIKPLHVGLAASQAIDSIFFAEMGLKSKICFLDDRLGFLSVYGNKEYKKSIFEHWGKPWRLESPGLWFKNYQYCSANSFVADAIDEIMSDNIDFLSSEINTITVTFTHNGDAALIYREPNTQSEGRFSAEYIIAKKLEGSSLTENDFLDIPVTIHTKKIMKKITRIVLGKQESTKRFVNIDIFLYNGKKLSKKIYYPKGSPKNPYTNDEFFRKLERSVESTQISLEMYDLIHKLPQVKNMKQFILDLDVLIQKSNLLKVRE